MKRLVALEVRCGFGLYVGYAASVGPRYMRVQNDRTRKLVAMIALGEKIGAQLSGAPGSSAAPGVAGKLEPGGPRSSSATPRS